MMVNDSTGDSIVRQKEQTLMRSITVLSLFVYLIANTSGYAANVENGAALAAEHCARCHDISEGGESRTMPPSFASIAAFRAEDQIFFRIMFPQMHSPMPAWSMMLSNDEAHDLTAFIMSLDPHPAAE